MKRTLLVAAISFALAACSGGGSTSTGTTTGGTGSSGTSANSSGGSSGASSSSSGGSTGTSGNPAQCGSVTPAGQCTGTNNNTAEYCGQLDDGGVGVVSIDCANYLPNEPAQCGTISAQYGVDCEAPTGQPCAFQLPDGSPFFAFCQGTTPGCFAATAGFSCENSTACSDFPDGGFDAVCAGNQLQLACQVNQPVGYDCQGFGGTCSNAQCVGLPQNAPCSPPTVNPPHLVCNSGLACTNLPDGGGYACE